MTRSHFRIVPFRSRWPAAGQFAVLLAILAMLALVVATAVGAHSLVRTRAQATAAGGWQNAISAPASPLPHVHHAADAAPEATQTAGAGTPQPVSGIPDDGSNCCIGPCPACVPALAPAAALRPLPTIPSSHSAASPLLRAGLIPAPALDPPRRVDALGLV